MRRTIAREFPSRLLIARGQHSSRQLEHEVHPCARHASRWLSRERRLYEDVGIDSVNVLVFRCERNGVPNAAMRPVEVLRPALLVAVANGHRRARVEPRLLCTVSRHRRSRLRERTAMQVAVLVGRDPSPPRARQGTAVLRTTTRPGTEACVCSRPTEVTISTRTPCCAGKWFAEVLELDHQLTATEAQRSRLGPLEHEAVAHGIAGHETAADSTSPRQACEAAGVARAGRTRARSRAGSGSRALETCARRAPRRGEHGRPRPGPRAR